MRIRIYLYPFPDPSRPAALRKMLEGTLDDGTPAKAFALAVNLQTELQCEVVMAQCNENEPKPHILGVLNNLGHFVSTTDVRDVEEKPFLPRGRKK